MKFTLFTDKGTFISMNQKELNHIQLMLQLSNDLVGQLYHGDIDLYPDEVQGLMSILRQMFYETNTGIQSVVEELTEEKEDDIISPPDDEKEEEPVQSGNVISFNRFKKEDT